MKSFLAAVFLTMATFLQAYSQAKPWITDVDFRIENEKVVVTYAISNYLPGQMFNIRLTFQTPDNRIIIPVSVFGDAGQGIQGGEHKTIVWNPAGEITDFRGLLKAVVTIVPGQAEQRASGDFQKMFTPVSRERGTGGPGYVAFSVLFPGLGGYFVEKNTSRAIGYNVLAAAVLTSIIVHNVKLNDLEDQYSAASTAERPGIQDDIDATEETLKTATIAYAVIWGTDILWVLFKGFKNQQSQKINRGFSLNYYDNQITAGYKIRF